jgi:hypothetical protein
MASKIAEKALGWFIIILMPKIGEMTQNDIIVRHTGGKIVGLNVLRFSKRTNQD